MCLAECKGDFYRACQYVRLYYTGQVTDCNRPDCVKSKAHMHKTATTCLCTQEYTDLRLVQNYMRTRCDACVEQSERRGRRRARAKRYA